MSREQFMGRMVLHILPKGFKRVRYYGLQAQESDQPVEASDQTGHTRVLGFIAEVPVSAVVKLSYRERMKRVYSRPLTL